MARPRSEEKRLALLNAAAETIAEHGLAAATALIAKRAGVAEGTLFRYFATKDELFNELYVYLNEQLFSATAKDIPVRADLRLRAQALWDSYIEWGLLNRAANETLNQLSVSSVLTASTRSKVEEMFPEHTLELSKAELFKDRSARYADAVFIALANTTMDFAASEPDRADAYKHSGFAIVWKLYGQN